VTIFTIFLNAEVTEEAEEGDEKASLRSILKNQNSKKEGKRIAFPPLVGKGVLLWLTLTSLEPMLAVGLLEQELQHLPVEECSTELGLQLQQLRQRHESDFLQQRSFHELTAS